MKPQYPIGMRGSGRFRVLLCLGIALFVVVSLVFWFSGKPNTESAAEKTDVTKVVNPSPPHEKAKKEPWVAGSETGNKDHDSGHGENVPQPVAPTPKLDSWMEKNWNLNDERLTDGLLEFVTKGENTVDERLGALSHALNLLSDKDYKKLVGILSSADTPQPVLMQIIADLHNRPEEPALWASLVLMQSQDTLVASEAKKVVAFLLDMEEANEVEALRLQGETRLIEIEEARQAVTP